jgi:hypothetical protein
MAGAGGPPESPHRDSTRPASYAVTKNADGTVTFTVHELRDLAGATKALNDAGIAGRVLVSTEGCTAGLNHADLVSVDFTGELTGDDTVVVSSSEYPPGGGVLIAVVGDVPDNPSVVEVAFVDRNKIPSCVDLTVYGRTTSTR